MLRFKIRYIRSCGFLRRPAAISFYRRSMLRMVYAKSLIFLGLLASCHPTDTANQVYTEAFQPDTTIRIPRLLPLSYTPNSLPPKTKIREFTILPFSEEGGDIFPGSKPTLLSEQEVDELYNLVQVFINDYNIKEKHRTKQFQKHYPKYSAVVPDTISLIRYRLQLIPAISNTGDKVVYIRGFSSDYFTRWRTRIVHQSDGGSSMFHVTINLSRRVWYKFHVNGDA